jgi:hypothetical protein
MESQRAIFVDLEFHRRVGGVAEGIDILGLHVAGFGESQEVGRFRVRLEGFDVTFEEFPGKLGDRHLSLVGEVERQDDGEHGPEEVGADRDEVASHGFIQAACRSEARD